MCELFNEANVPYNLHQDVSFRSYNVKTVLYSTETLLYLEPKIWNVVSFDIRDCATEQIFRQKIKKWKPDKCPCRLCKIYIPNLGLKIPLRRSHMCIKISLIYRLIIL